MPLTTPVLGLPYPGPGDEPCDFDEQWCAFTDAVEARLTVLDEAIARTNPVVPAALLHQTTDREVLPDASIPFDAVLLDTARMTDIDADPYHIYIPRTGRYTITAWTDQETAGINNSPLFLSGVNYNGGQGTYMAEVLDRLGSVSYRFGIYQSVVSATEGDRWSLLQSSMNMTVPRTIFESWFSVVWHSDTEVP